MVLEWKRTATRVGAVLDHAGVARRFGHLVAAFDALWALTKRNVSEAAQTGIPGIGGSIFKLSFSEHAQALGDLAHGDPGPGRIERRPARTGPTAWASGTPSSWPPGSSRSR